MKSVNYSDPDFVWFPLTPTDISNMPKQLGEIMKVDSITMLDNNHVRLGTKTVGACFKSKPDPVDNSSFDNMAFKVGPLTFYGGVGWYQILERSLIIGHQLNTVREYLNSFLIWIIVNPPLLGPGGIGDIFLYTDDSDVVINAQIPWWNSSFRIM